jgi:hypothetical protein
LERRCVVGVSPEPIRTGITLKFKHR